MGLSIVNPSHMEERPQMVGSMRGSVPTESHEVILEEHKVKRGSQYIIGHGGRSNGNQEDDDMFNAITERDD